MTKNRVQAEHATECCPNEHESHLGYAFENPCLSAGLFSSLSLPVMSAEKNPKQPAARLHIVERKMLHSKGYHGSPPFETCK